MRPLAWLCATLIALPVAATAATRLHVTELLADPQATRSEFELTGVRTPSGGSVSLQLTPFEVWTADAEVIVVGADGIERAQPIPETAFFRGHIQGDPASRVYLSVEPDGASTGLVRHPLGTLHSLVATPSADGIGLNLLPVDMDAMAAGRPAFQCQQGRLPEVPPAASGGSGDAPVDPVRASTPDGTLYRARLAIDSDWEFRQRFASSAAATTYIGNLVGYASTIYIDQLDTQLQVSYSRVFDNSSDPYTQTDSLCALYEFGKHWNDNFGGTSRTIAHFVSGKNSGGGVAWLGVLCEGAFNVNATDAACPAGGPTGTSNYGGGYGFTGSMTGSFNAAAPTAVWDIVAFAHEVGHNFNSPHTHCYRNLGGNANAVDTCYGQEPDAACHAGSNSLPGAAGQGSGTIMSYCHLLSPGMSNIGLTLGGTAASPHPFGTAPLRVPSRMRAHVVARAAGNPSCLALGGGGFTVGGTLSGLASGQSVVLRNATTAENLTRTSNGAYSFPTMQATGALYSVAVQTQPATQLCSVAGGSGTIGTANVTNVNVSCVNTYTVGGSVSGLASGRSVVLRNTVTGENLTRTATGSYAFTTRQATGATYNVIVQTQPDEQTCTVANPGGTVGTSNVTNVSVSCVTRTYPVGGTLSGLAAGRSIVIRNSNTNENLTRTANGAFTFATNQAAGASYTISVQTQPVGQTCTVSAGSGTVPSGGLSSIVVSCVNNSYTLALTGRPIARGSSDTITATLSGPNVGGASFRLCVDGSRASLGAATIPTGLPGLSCVAANTGCPAGTSVGLLCSGNHTTAGSAWSLPQTLTIPATVAAGAPLGDTPFAVASGPEFRDRNLNVLTVDVTPSVITVTGNLRVGGTVSGLNAGNSILLRNTVTGESLSRNANGAWTFLSPQPSGSSYNVQIQTQPTGQFCTLANASGTLGSTDISNIAVSCGAPPYTLTSAGPTLSPGGSGNATVTLAGTGVAGAQFRLCVDGNRLTLSTANVPVGLNGFSCAAPTVGGCPAGTTIGISCAGFVASGSWALPQTVSVPISVGTGAALGTTPLRLVDAGFSDANGGKPGLALIEGSVNVIQAYTVGGTISGLGTGLSVVLRNASTGENLTRTANGTYAFATAQATGANFNVSVLTPPTGQTCTVANATGTVGTANVTNVNVSCTTNTYTVGGTISGLGTGLSVVLRNASTGENLTRTANGTYAFTTAQATGANFNVSVLTPPTGQACTVANATGTVGTANVTNVNVSCTTNTYTVGGTISGLGTGLSVVLRNASTGENLTRTANGTYAFATAQATGANFNVSVLTQPTSQACTVANATGTVGTANVTNVNVSCTTNTYTVGGTISGLGTGLSVVLRNASTGENLTRNANGTYAFTTAQATGANFNVSVLTQPTGQACTVANATGTVGTA
ncbi:MAG: M12 family metallo-peptidase, partial [Xanthomonadales bacterium]|nr:M12 family metallo-peptidase [Xanthomonadales bacterium]